jgi:hypothetical protein
MSAAQPLARADRAAFLEAVVAALDGRPIGDGAVFRAIRDVQGRYLDAPKWGRAESLPKSVTPPIMAASIPQLIPANPST